MATKRPHYQTVKAAIRKSEKVFTRQEVAAALRASELHNMQNGLLDNKYWAVSRDAWEKILAFNLTDRKAYQSDRYDCDNFAISLAGSVATKWDINGCGIVIDGSGGHAYSALLINNDGKLEIAVVEPQDDWFVIFVGRGHYAAKGGMIILA